MVEIDDMFSHTKGVSFRHRLTPEAREFLEAVEAKVIEEGRPPVFKKVRDALEELGVNVGATTVSSHFHRLAREHGLDFSR